MFEKHLKKCSTSLIIRGNANQNNPEIPSHTSQNGQNQKLRGQQMLERMWRKRNTPPLLVGLQAGKITLEIGLAIPQKTGHSYYLRTQLYHSWAYTQKMLQHSIGHMLHYVHSSLIYNSQKLERTQIYHSWAYTQKMLQHAIGHMFHYVHNL